MSWRRISQTTHNYYKHLIFKMWLTRVAGDSRNRQLLYTGEPQLEEGLQAQVSEGGDYLPLSH